MLSCPLPCPTRCVLLLSRPHCAIAVTHHCPCLTSNSPNPTPDHHTRAQSRRPSPRCFCAPCHRAQLAVVARRRRRALSCRDSPLGSPCARAGNEPNSARLGSARCGSVPERARLGSARPFHELVKEARLGSTLAREPARLGSRAIFWYFSLHYLVN
jgi:hypothetical protein